MPQTQEHIHSYFSSRKRSVSECIPSPGTSNAKKLVALDDGNLSPVRSPARARHLRAARNERPGSLESIRETHLQKAERIAPTLLPVDEKNDKNKPTVLDEKFKKFIRNNKKYPALRAAVKKLSTTIDHLKENAPPSEPIMVSVPGLCESTKPCFVRFEDLVTVSPDTLVLPSKYVTLEDIFNGVETVVRSLANKHERITFKLIQLRVERLTGRKFSSQYLSMIKTVYPDSYELTYELESLNDEIVDIIIEEPKSRVVDIDERKKIFHELLLERTKFHHQEFLKTLNPPLVLSATAQIRRWHPLFDLSSVPDILPTLIPRLSFSRDTSNFKESTEKKPSESSVLSLRCLELALNSVPKSVLVKIRASTTARNLVV